MTERFLIALLLTLIAGLSTGLGAAIAFFAPRANTRFLSVCTGLSAGVMLYVSFMEILPEAFAQIMEAGLAETPATALGTLGFFLGIALIFLIDRLVPDAENPHETHPKGDYLALRDPAQAATPAERRAIRKATRQTRRTLLRMGAFTALAITVHNFPEGLSTFLAALVDPHLGAVIAFAIALHNIPEGISVSVPIYYATGNRRRAFVWSCLAGFAEPAGALFLWAVLALCHGPADAHGPRLRRRRRHHGLHQPRRAPPRLPRLRQGPRLPLRPRRRHGPHGPLPPPPLTLGPARRPLRVPSRNPKGFVPKP